VATAQHRIRVSIREKNICRDDEESHGLGEPSVDDCIIGQVGRDAKGDGQLAAKRVKCVTGSTHAFSDICTCLPASFSESAHSSPSVPGAAGIASPTTAGRTGESAGNGIRPNEGDLYANL
jgi:hypothetical protein